MTDLKEISSDIIKIMATEFGLSASSIRIEYAAKAILKMLGLNDRKHSDKSDAEYIMSLKRQVSERGIRFSKEETRRKKLAKEINILRDTLYRNGIDCPVTGKKGKKL